MATTQENGDMADPASKKIEAVSDVQMKSEPDDVEPAYTESVGSEIADQLPISTEMVYSHTDCSELVASQPMDSTSVHPVPVYTVTLPDSPNAEVNREQAEVEAMAIEEQVSIAYVDEHQFLSEQFDGEAEPMSADMHGQQPSVSVMDYQQSELVYSQPDGSEPFDHNAPSSVYNGETLHQKADFIKTEHAFPELMQINGSEIVQSPGPEVDHITALGSAALQTQPSKSRKKKSEVWNHFEIETVSPDCRRARCKVCLQSFAYSTGSKVSGTSHLKRHVAKGGCPHSLRQQTNNQSTPLLPKSAEAKPKPATTGTAASRKRRCRSSSTPYLVFDQDRCRLDIARMIIMHEYPLHMVEHPGLLSFVQHLQPRFNMVNVNTVQADCVTTYLKEKQSLQKLIDGMPGRLCLTLDVWTSNQTTGYVFLHGQFIDQEWKLQRRLLNVMMEPFPESDTALSHAVATCLSYWNLNSKLHSITFNQPVSDAAQENLRGLLSIKNAILSGQLLIRSCLACTLSGMAMDVLAAGQGAVKKVRSSVKYVKTSDIREDKFLKLKQQLQVPSDKTLVLDNVTRWDSTYHMLGAACKAKEVFSCLDALDTEYTDAPTADDWKQAEIVGFYLKLLFETASLLEARIPPSTEAFFHEVWKIQLELARAAASTDSFVSSIAVSLQEKFGEYWKDSCVVLAIAVAMDPRFKMKLVEFSFSKLFGEEANAYITMVNEGIHSLFNEYAEDRRIQENQPRSLVSSIGLSDFDKYIMETSSQQEKSELDQYLDESLLPRVQDFDILGWWKLNEVKYPTLTRMALDALSVPLSSVGSDHVFDTVGREMGEHRSSLRPETLEALMCAKDWLRYEGLEPEAIDGQVKTEAGLNKPLL